MNLPFKIIFLFFLLVITGCLDDITQEPELAIDEELERIKGEAENIEGLRSLLISHEGQLVYEHYYKVYQPDSLDHIRSVTKSIMGILIGIAIQKGIIPSPDIKISQYLGAKDGFDDRHQNITLHHLLTMSGGFQWDESDVSEFNNWVLSDNRINNLLQRQVIDSPGSVFNYNSAGSHLLAVILQEASGISARDFADQHLFGPLSIDAGWQNLDNYTNGASGLRLKPRDIIKLGQLMVNDGYGHGMLIIEGSWISTSLFPHINTNQVPAMYGYQWWINPDIPELHGIAIGYGGQYLAVIPELNAVIVTTSEYRYLGQDKAFQQSVDIYNMIWNNIYPYLKER